MCMDLPKVLSEKQEFLLHVALGTHHFFHELGHPPKEMLRYRKAFSGLSSHHRAF